MITELIDKQDNFIVIRDRIAQILVDELANQQILAANESKDPSLWEMEVYTERNNPWEKWLNDQSEANKIPIVNVWFENSSVEGSTSNVVERQKLNGTFNVDVYALGVSKSEGNGHVAGDEDAAREVQRALVLVRNILMAGEYTYLGFPRKELQFVWGRMIQSITAFQPEQQGGQAQNVQAIRVSMNVGFNEFSPQVQGEILELITNDIKRQEDGQVIAQANYTYPQ